MRKVAISSAVVIICLALLFALQNMTEVELIFLLWTFQTPRFVIVLASIGAGILIGVSLFTAFAIGSKRRSPTDHLATTANIPDR